MPNNLIGKNTSVYSFTAFCLGAYDLDDFDSFDSSFGADRKSLWEENDGGWLWKISKDMKDLCKCPRAPWHYRRGGTELHYLWSYRVSLISSLLYCKYSSFHFPKLGICSRGMYLIQHLPIPLPRKRISQQGPYS